MNKYTSSSQAVITKTFQVSETCVVSINNEISCSLSQPFLTTKGLKKGVELQRGDVLMKINNKPEPILDLRYEDKTIGMFMIALSENHLFYAADYIVHKKIIDTD
jgi:hypothetical protein